MSKSRLNKSEEGIGPGQGASVEYEITDGHRVSSPGNLTKGNNLEGDWRDDGQAT